MLTCWLGSNPDMATLIDPQWHLFWVFWCVLCSRWCVSFPQCLRSGWRPWLSVPILMKALDGEAHWQSERLSWSFVCENFFKKMQNEMIFSSRLRQLGSKNTLSMSTLAAHTDSNFQTGRSRRGFVKRSKACGGVNDDSSARKPSQLLRV